MKKLILTCCFFVGLFLLAGCDIGYTPDDYNNRGIYKMQNGDTEGAVEDFKKAWTEVAEAGYSEKDREVYFNNWISAVQK